MITAAMVRTIYPAMTSNGNFIIAVLGIIKGKVDYCTAWRKIKLCFSANDEYHSGG